MCKKRKSQKKKLETLNEKNRELKDFKKKLEQRLEKKIKK